MLHFLATSNEQKDIVSVLNILCDLICDVITCSLAVFEAVIRVKSMHREKLCLKITKSINMKIKEFFLHKSPSKDRLNIEFTAY